MFSGPMDSGAMATLMHFGDMILTKQASEELRRSMPHVLRKRPTMASMCMGMGDRQPRLKVNLSSRQGVVGEDIPALCVGGDVVRSISSDALWRGEPPDGSELFKRNGEKSLGGRREFMMWSLLLSSATALTSTTAETAAAAEGQHAGSTEVPLEPYSDAKGGFTLLRPAPWNKVEKPGAAIFFEDPKSKSNNIGVTVAPVRIASLDGFGTVEDVVRKLVKAERDKPSTNDMQVISVLVKKLKDNIPLYSLEYTLDTTRGSKRVLTSVTVSGYKLYILSIIFADGPVAPASSVLNDALHQVLNSFELVA